MYDFVVPIEAAIEAAGGKVAVSAERRNSWSNFNNENFERGIQRALDEFAVKVNALPLDLSRMASK